MMKVALILLAIGLAALISLACIWSGMMQDINEQMHERGDDE